MLMRTPICARRVSTVPGKSRTRDGPVFLPPFTETKTRPVAFLPPAGPALEEQVFEGLEMSVKVDQEVLEAGDDGRGGLVLRNSSPERIGPLHCGQPLVGSLLNSSLETVGGYSGAVAGTGLTIDLAPGESASVRVIFGTASTREDLGYVLPPGRYWLRVQMRLHHGRGTPGADHDHPPKPGAQG